MNNQRVAKLLILLLCLQINDITFCSDEGDFTFNTKADESHKAATKQDTENEKDTAIYAVERQNAQNNAKKMTAATNADKQSVADQSNVASKETITLSNDIVAKDTQSSGSIEKNVEKQAAIEARRARDTKKTLGDMFNEGLSRVQVRASDITKKIPDSVKKIFNDIFASSDLKAELQDIKERDVSEVEKQNLERAARLEDKIKRIKRKNISEKDKKNFEQNIRAVAEDRVAELQKFKEDITKAENNLEKAKKALMTDTAKYQVTNSDGKMVKKTYKEIVDKVQSIKDTKNYYKNHKLSKELAVLSLKVSEIENKKKFTVGQKPNTKEETLSGLEKATKDIKHEHQVALQKLANQERAILIQAGGTSWANTIMDWLGKAKDLITKKTGGENKSVVTSGQNSLAESSDVVTQNSDKDLSKTILSTENKSSTNDANLDQQAASTSKATVTSV
ncbi:MAG: hypothetical protein CL947_00005, partial [Epsilonproteobacteria bacterium]|nr:hypothetical protein [Campylobacterota bacterium]